MRASGLQTPYITPVNYSVEHLGLPARNPVTLQEWYQHALQAELVYANNQAPPAFFLRLPGGLLLEIYEGDFSLKETADNTLNGWRHLALRVDSLDSAKHELLQRGVQFDSFPKPAGGGGRVLFFKDAEGNLLHLVERPSDSVFAPKPC